jgi:hypothetical protein
MPHILSGLTRRSGYLSLNQTANLHHWHVKGKQMIETRIRPARHALATGDGADASDSRKSRLAIRLWTLLHAQALLEGTIVGPGGALSAEDDRWRLAARRESAHRR